MTVYLLDHQNSPATIELSLLLQTMRSLWNSSFAATWAPRCSSG